MWLLYEAARSVTHTHHKASWWQCFVINYVGGLHWFPRQLKNCLFVLFLFCFVKVSPSLSNNGKGSSESIQPYSLGFIITLRISCHRNIWTQEFIWFSRVEYILCVFTSILIYVLELLCVNCTVFHLFSPWNNFFKVINKDVYAFKSELLCLIKTWLPVSMVPPAHFSSAHRREQTRPA